MKLTTGKTYWCEWKHCYLIFMGMKGKTFMFEDFGDCRFYLTKAEVMSLL